MRQPDVRYAKSTGGYIAFQVRGGGPVDLLYMSEWVIPLHAMSEGYLGRFLERLNRFARVVTWDRPGVGQSDPLPAGLRPSLEQWVDDAIAVMDEVGIERAAILGSDIGGQVAMLFAATHPERTSGLVLVNTCARYRLADDHPCGVPDDAVDGFLGMVESAWGHGYPPPELLAPDHVDDVAFQTWSDNAQRLGASPATGRAILEMSCNVDLRPVLPAIHVPTLVMHSRGDRLMGEEQGRCIAAAVPAARFVSLPGNDHPIFLTDADRIADETQEFLTGASADADDSRVVVTVLFTDIVGSTELATRLGDRKWRELLDTHDRLVAEQIRLYRGRRISSTGDGVLATFDGPGRAIRCAVGIHRAAEGLGLTLRAGLHAGEIEIRGSEIAGVGVHIASRVCDLAGAGEVLVSRTVVDLVAGGGFTFDDGRDLPLKGVPGTWRIFRLTGE